MRTFHATVVESFSEYDVLTVHFDDGKDQYLQFQFPEQIDDPREWEDGYGAVDVIVDDQFNSGINCFSEAVLRRDRFRIVFARDPHMTRLGGVEVTFDVDDTAFAELRDGLVFGFRGYQGFQVVASPGA